MCTVSGVCNVLFAQRNSCDGQIVDILETCAVIALMVGIVACCRASGGLGRNPSAFCVAVSGCCKFDFGIKFRLDASVDVSASTVDVTVVVDNERIGYVLILIADGTLTVCMVAVFFAAYSFASRPRAIGVA